MSPRFGNSGRDDSRPSKDDIEREAAAELARLTARSQAQAHDAPARSWQATPQPQPPGRRGATGGARPTDDDTDDGWDEYTPDDEEMAVTEMALQQLAERRGGRDLSDFAMRTDRASAEAARDRALRQVLDRQEQRASKKFNPLSPWKQERWVVGGPKGGEADDEAPAWAGALSQPGDRLVVGGKGAEGKEGPPDAKRSGKAKAPAAKAKKGKSSAKTAKPTTARSTTKSAKTAKGPAAKTAKAPAAKTAKGPAAKTAKAPSKTAKGPAAKTAKTAKAPSKTAKGPAAKTAKAPAAKTAKAPSKTTKVASAVKGAPGKASKAAAAVKETVAKKTGAATKRGEGVRPATGAAAKKASASASRRRA